MSSSSDEPEEQVEVVLEVHSVPSTPDPPMEEWSSVLFVPEEENLKCLQHAEGLYDPGSGEICAKYITQSASSVFRHPYYKYPCITDPGIEKAFLHPEYPVFYDIDGKDLYIAKCKEINQCPVQLFYEGLIKNEIDLSYYCVNPFGVHAMAVALEVNPFVTVLNLTENFLNDDACFHLGDLLSKNSNLKELNLTGCRIGASGVRRILNGLLKNKTLKVLNLNSNELEDDGALLIAQAIDDLSVTDIYLSYNKLGSAAILAFAENMEYKNDLRKLDLSWNSICLPNLKGICSLLNRLAENPNFEWLNLSWNAIADDKVAFSLKKLLLAPELSYLNLKNNKIEDDFITKMAPTLSKAKKLTTLDLSNNPFTTVGSLSVLSRLRFRGAGVKNLLMENIPVDETFVAELARIKNLKFRTDLKVSTGIHTKVFQCKGPDMREVLLNRFEVVCKKPKRKSARIDFALFILQLAKDVGKFIDMKTFETTIKAAGPVVEGDLIAQLSTAFPGPIVAKEKTIDLVKLVDYIHRKWPDAKLPPTPPPEPEPEPLPPPPSAKKGKGKGKAKAEKVERGGGDAPPKKEGKGKGKK